MKPKILLRKLHCSARQRLRKLITLHKLQCSEGEAPYLGYRVNIFSVWGPDREACKRLYAKLGDPQNVELDLALYHHEDLLEKLKSYTLTINFKLHASCLSAAASVPFISLGYRFKCIDFGLSAGLSDYVLSTGDPKLRAEILDRVVKIEKEANTIREKFYTHQNRYRELLKKPFYEELL